MSIEVGEKVQLVTFNGALASSGHCDNSENYWALINSTGTVVNPENNRGRLTVVFDNDVKCLGLHCHNEIPNSLYILPSDLVVISHAKKI